MPIGRNDLCHCGSGRKYKNCCLAADAARAAESMTQEASGVVPLRRPQLPPAVRSAAGRERTWAADAVPVPVTFEEEGVQRPVLIAVTAGDLFLHHDLRRRLGGEAADVAKVLSRAVRAAGAAVGVLPERLLVRHAPVAEALEPLLEGRDVVVEAGPTPELESVIEAAFDHLFVHAQWPPVGRALNWGAWGLPQHLVARTFTSAALFYRLAPWRYVGNLQAPRAILPSGRQWTCCVLGNGGEEYGLALYSDTADLFEIMADAEEEEGFRRVQGRIVSIIFDPAEQAGGGAMAEARRHRWEVAGPHAWPSLLMVNTPGGGASCADVEDLATLLRAVPAYVEAHRQELLREERSGVTFEVKGWVEPETGVTFRYAGEGAVPGPAPVRDPGLLPPEFRDEVADIVRQVGEGLGAEADEATFMSEVNARLEEHALDHNQRPQAELGGLSPSQVQRLLYAEWDQPDSPVRLRRDLDLDRLANALILHNARSLLDLAIERDGLDATGKGNLNLEAVKTLLERWRSDDGFPQLLLKHSKRIREEDAPPLHRLRVVCQLAGLLRKRSQRFLPTKKARELASPDRAGELFALLFETWLRKFNLDYDGYLDWPELQRQAVFTLYKLPRAARDWRSPAELLLEVVLPFALDRGPVASDFDPAPSAFAGRLLHVLVDFGLLERRETEPPHRSYEMRYRATELASTFIDFDL